MGLPINCIERLSINELNSGQRHTSSSVSIIKWTSSSKYKARQRSFGPKLSTLIKQQKRKPIYAISLMQTFGHKQLLSLSFWPFQPIDDDRFAIAHSSSRPRIKICQNISQPRITPPKPGIASTDQARQILAKLQLWLLTGVVNNPHLIDRKDKADGYWEAIQTEWLEFIQYKESST